LGAEATNGEAFPGNTLRSKIMGDGLGAALGELLVVVDRSNVVGVAEDGDPRARPDRTEDAVQDLGRTFDESILVEVEEDFAWQGGAGELCGAAPDGIDVRAGPGVAFGALRGNVVKTNVMEDFTLLHVGGNVDRFGAPGRSPNRTPGFGIVAHRHVDGFSRAD